MNTHRSRPSWMIIKQLLHQAFVLLVPICLLGCSVTNNSSTPTISSNTRPDHHIIALVDGGPILRDQIEDDLAERAGRYALEDLILDLTLDREAKKLGIEITDSDLEQEQQRLFELLETPTTTSAETDMLLRIRASRGLGPERYQRFLRRNAILRKLISKTSQPSEKEYARAERIIFGKHERIRLFVNPDRAQTQQSRQRVLDAPPNARRWVLAQECAQYSIHPSADRGGLISNFSIADPNYPPILSETVGSITIDEVSSLLATDSGYAFLIVEAHLPPTPIDDEQRENIRDQVLIRHQRRSMEQLAQQLIAQSDVRVLDDALSWSWKNRP